VELNRCIHVLGRNGYLDGALRGEVVTVSETLQGLEVKSGGK
jgi:hypothetical protein